MTYINVFTSIYNNPLRVVVVRQLNKLLVKGEGRLYGLRCGEANGGDMMMFIGVVDWQTTIVDRRMVDCFLSGVSTASRTTREVLATISSPPCAYTPLFLG